jgi:hypothetical protein
MVGETHMTHQNGNGRSTAPPVVFSRNMSQLAHDVVELGELQASLVRLEIEGWWKQLIVPAVLLVVALVIGLSSMPVLILSGAYGLQQATSLSLAVCLLISGGGAVLLAAVIGAIGWAKLKSAQAPLSESRRELSRNVRWIKSVLQHKAGPSQALRTTQPKPGGNYERNFN